MMKQNILIITKEILYFAYQIYFFQSRIKTCEISMVWIRTFIFLSSIKPENTDSVYLCLNKATEQNLNQRYSDEKGEQGHTFNDQTFAQQAKAETVE